MIYHCYSVFYFFAWVILWIMCVLIAPAVLIFTGKLPTAPHLEIERSKDCEKHALNWGDGFWIYRKVTWQNL